MNVRAPSAWSPCTVGAGETCCYSHPASTTFAAADSIYVFRITADAFEPGTVLDSLWLVGVGLIALAAWQRPQSPGAAAIVHTIVELAQRLGIAVVAEGSKTSTPCGA